MIDGISGGLTRAILPALPPSAWSLCRPATINRDRRTRDERRGGRAEVGDELRHLSGSISRLIADRASMIFSRTSVSEVLWVAAYTASCPSTSWVRT